MRVEIVRELDPDDDKLEIPWANPEDPELRYVDLKAHPQAIATLEECRRHSPLAAMLRAINTPRSVLRSAKCDVWTTSDLTDDERLDFDLPQKVGSYVDVVFDRPEFNSDPELQVELGEKLGSALRDARVQAQMEICLRRCLFHPEERWGYYLTIFVHAYGQTQVEAEREWARAMTAVREAWESIDWIPGRRRAGPSASGPGV